MASRLVATGLLALAPALAGWSAGALAAQDGAGRPRTVTARGPLDTEERAIVELFERSRGSVVYIAPTQRVFSPWTRNALQVERSTMRLILLLIVAIAAMNIISGLVMLVKNKGRDIAILRTMGASQGSILRIFFMSGASIGVFGTIAGLVLGALFVTFIDPIQTAVEAMQGN